jgi:Flp pilus assembly protein TadB
VGNLQGAINSLLQFLRQFSVMIANLLTEFEFWLRDQLRGLGVPHTLQTVILLGVAVLLVVGALRLLGGLIRVVVVLLLVLLVIHLVMPVIQG